MKRFAFLIAVMMMAIAAPAMAQAPSGLDPDLKAYLDRSEKLQKQTLDMATDAKKFSELAFELSKAANATANEAKAKADLALKQSSAPSQPNIHIVVNGSTATATSTSRAPAQRTTVVRPRYAYPAYPYYYPVAEFYSPDGPAVGGYYYHRRVDAYGYIHLEKRYWYPSN